MTINSVTLSGNLTRDLEVRPTPSGFPIGQVGVAVNERRKNPQSGEYEDKPNYFDLVILGDRASKLAPYLTKGTKVTVQGKLRYSAWEKDGQKRSKVDVLVDGIEFMSRREGGQQGYQPAPQQGYQTAPQAAPAYQQAPAPAPAQTAFYDADIPF